MTVNPEGSVSKLTAFEIHWHLQNISAIRDMQLSSIPLRCMSLL